MRHPRIGTWPPLRAGILARTAGWGSFPFPLGSESCRLYARARHGLWHGVQAIGLRPGEGVLVPACHHGAEVEALAQAGLEPPVLRWREGPPARRGGARSACSGPARARCYLIHHLGFPQDAPPGALVRRAWPRC